MGKIENNSLAKIIHNPLLKDQIFSLYNVRAVAHPHFQRDANLVFVDKTTGKPFQISLFGKQISSVQVTDTPKNTSTKDNLFQATPDTIDNWSEFYSELASTRLIDTIGPKAWELSGLKEVTKEGSEKLNTATYNFLSSQTWQLQQMGVETTQTTHGLDFAFLNREGKINPIKLHHIRTAQQKNSLLVKQICHEPVLVPGIILPKPGETEREYNNRLCDWQSKNPELTLPFIGAGGGQFSAWRKLGAFDELANIGNTNMRSVVDTLFLGTGTDNPGILARPPFNLSLPILTEQDGLILFQKGNERIELSNLTGLDLHKLKKGESGFRPVDNVSAMIFVPDDASTDQLKQVIKQYKLSMRTIWGNPNSLPLLATPKLLNRWQDKGILFPEDQRQEILKRDPLERKIEYRTGVQNSTYANFQLFWTGPQVGGARFSLNYGNEREEIRYVVDMGAIYKGLPPEETSLMGRPGTAQALRQPLSSGQIPMTPGLLSIESMLAAANPEWWPSLFDPRDQSIVSYYVRSELAVRAGSRLSESLDQAHIESLTRLGLEASKKWYPNGKQIIYAGAIFSHAHADHTGAAGSLADTEIFVSDPTASHMQAISNKASWAGKLTQITDVHKGLNSGKYDNHARKLTRAYFPNTPIILDNNVSLRFFPVDHSIVGSTAIGLEVKGFGRVLYTGDWKEGSYTKKSLPQMADFKPDLIVAECTNPPITDKASANISTYQAMENIKKVITRRETKTDLVVIFAPPNHTDRLEQIIEIGHATGRTVAIGYGAADILQHLKNGNQTAPQNSMFSQNKIPRLGQDFLLFTKPMAKSTPWQVALVNQSAGNTIDLEYLSNHAGEIILVLSPYDLPEKVLGGASLQNRITAIWSAPFPYSPSDQSRVGAIFNSIRNRMGGKIYADYNVFGLGGRVSHGDDPENMFHSGGHTTGPQNFEYISQILARQGPSHTKTTVAFVHGAHTKSYGDAAKLEFALRGLNPIILTRFNHYDPTDPIKKQGHFIDL